LLADKDAVRWVGASVHDSERPPTAVEADAESDAFDDGVPADPEADTVGRLADAEIDLDLEPETGTVDRVRDAE
jgi:hypothetical protein